MAATITIDNKLGLTTKERLAMDHHVYYQMIINYLGYDKVKECVPFDLETLIKAYKEDDAFNNLKLNTWDYAGGFSVFQTRYEEKVIPTHSRLRSLLKDSGINCYSCSEGVCILKECARMMVEEATR